MNRAMVAFLLFLAAVPLCDAQDDAAPPPPPEPKRKPKGRKKGKHSLMLAETDNSVTTVRVNEAKAYQAGDYYVWNNVLWTFDDTDNAPADPVGTSRGACILLASGDVEQVPGHCSWTLTIHETDKGGTIEENKLIIMGDVDDVMQWDTVQTLAIVGGTGEYEGAAGAIDVVSESSFFIYDIYLD